MHTIKGNINAFLLCALLLSVIILILMNKMVSNSQPKQLFQPTLTPTPFEDEITSQTKAFREILPQFPELMSNIKNGKVIYEKDGNVETYSKGLYKQGNDPWLTIGITVRKYFPGSTIEQGYEGMRWEISLDNDVKLFDNFSQGTKIAKINSFGGLNSRLITSKYIKGKPYLIYDDYFKPGGNWSHHYLAFDKTSKLLSEIAFSFKVANNAVPVKFTQANQSNEYYYTEVIYPDYIYNIISEFESYFP